MKDGKITMEDAYLLVSAFAIRENCKKTSCVDCIFYYGYGDCRLKEEPVIDWNLDYGRR